MTTGPTDPGRWAPRHFTNHLQQDTHRTMTSSQTNDSTQFPHYPRVVGQESAIPSGFREQYRVNDVPKLEPLPRVKDIETLDSAWAAALHLQRPTLKGKKSARPHTPNKTGTITQSHKAQRVKPE